MDYLAFLLLLGGAVLVPLGPRGIGDADLSAKLIDLEAIIAKDEKASGGDAATTAAASTVPNVLLAPVALNATNAATGDELPTAPRLPKKQGRLMHAMAALRINVDRGDYTGGLISAQALANADHSKEAQAAITAIITELLAIRTARRSRRQPTCTLFWTMQPRL